LEGVARGKHIDGGRCATAGRPAPRLPEFYSIRYLLWSCSVRACRPPRLGFDPSTFAGHSLRAGFVTSAVKRGANLIKITDVTGHRSLEMLKTYSRDAEAFVGHAGAGLL
jgi:hypothetical protein